MTDGPWTFDQSLQAAGAARRAQAAAEDFMREAAKKQALAEERYRIALANKILELHDKDNVAWSSTADLARGDRTVAELRRHRDIAEGVREAAVQAAWRRAADRRDTERFVSWSMRRELAEGYGQMPDPEYERPIGSRRGT